jgi:hypothetical protein
MHIPCKTFLYAAGVFACSFLFLPEIRAQEKEKEQVKGVLAEPLDAAEIREQVATIEGLGDEVPDRGAILYFRATARQHLGETREALALLKECLTLREGFDPSGSPEFFGLKGTKEFDDLVASVHRDFPEVSSARLGFLTEERDLIPEGLAYDPKRKNLYLSSLNRRKIVKIDAEGRSSDFVSGNLHSLLPILGIRLDATDDTIWAASFDEAGKTELLHFDSAGALLGWFSPGGNSQHGFNDLVVRKSGEVVVTDSLSNQVVRFNPRTHRFEPLKIKRPLFYPNGIALAEDDQTLFVADSLGMIRISLADGTSQDIDPGPRNTLAGADGLYWYKGNLLAVQNGIGSPRIALFKLSRDGTRVVKTTVLENRTQFTPLPTTGAISGGNFYFIANSQIDNLNGNKVMDVTRLAPIRIAVLRLP